MRWRAGWAAQSRPSGPKRSAVAPPESCRKSESLCRRVHLGKCGHGRGIGEAHLARAIGGDAGNRGNTGVHPLPGLVGGNQAVDAAPGIVAGLVHRGGFTDAHRLGIARPEPAEGLGQQGGSMMRVVQAVAHHETDVVAGEFQGLEHHLVVDRPAAGKEGPPGLAGDNVVVAPVLHENTDRPGFGLAHQRGKLLGPLHVDVGADQAEDAVKAGRGGATRRRRRRPLRCSLRRCRDRRGWGKRGWIPATAGTSSSSRNRA